MPDGAGDECRHAALEPWLLARGSNALVDAFPKPDVGLHVPRIQENFEVGSYLDRRNVDVRGTAPEYLSGFAVPTESETCDITCTLRAVVSLGIRVGLNVSHKPRSTARQHSI